MAQLEDKKAIEQAEVENIQASILRWALKIENSEKTTQALNTFQASMTAFAHGMQQIVPKVLPVLEQFGRIGLAMREAQRREALLADSGWLPHIALPLAQLADHTTADAVDGVFTEYMKTHWQEVRDGLKSRLEILEVNQSSKDVFEEAMVAHEAGLYRCVCRTLMPEIERAVRIDLNGGKLAYPKTNPERSNPTKLLKDTAGNLAFHEAGPGGWFTAILFRKLSEHLYERIDEDQAKLAIFERDPVPNRHATVHGLIDYGTLKNSINAIFMTDYAFQVISAAATSTP